MTKADLVGAIADAAKLSKADALRAVDAFTATIEAALKRNEQVSITGFGIFLVRDRAARTGRNPQTGQTIEIAASRHPAFKPSKALKDALN